MVPVSRPIACTSHYVTYSTICTYCPAFLVMMINPPPKIRTGPKLRTAPKIRTTWGFPPSGAKIRTTLDTSKTKAGNTEEFFVHQLLAEIGSDGSLALCCWQVADRSRFMWVQAIKNVHFF